MERVYRRVRQPGGWCSGGSASGAVASLIMPSVVIGLGIGAMNALPLELQALQTNATTPVIYALGTCTTAVSLGIILCCLSVALTVQGRRARSGGDPA